MSVGSKVPIVLLFDVSEISIHIVTGPACDAQKGVSLPPIKNSLYADVGAEPLPSQNLLPPLAKSDDCILLGALYCKDHSNTLASCVAS